MDIDPVGNGNYVVQPGDCMASIAFEHGFLWQTLWDLPQNSDLKTKRKDPYVLLPGDQVYIPDPRLKGESGSVDQNHKFVLEGAVEQLQIVITDDQDKPIPNLPYTLTVDGKTVRKVKDRHGHKITGFTDGSGMIKQPIPPNAHEGRLIVGEGSKKRDYNLMFGYVAPADCTPGLQARLLDLGFYVGDVPGTWDAKTASALLRFQDKYNLTPSQDDLSATQAQAKDLFGC